MTHEKKDFLRKNHHVIMYVVMGIVALGIIIAIVYFAFIRDRKKDDDALIATNSASGTNTTSTSSSSSAAVTSAQRIQVYLSRYGYYLSMSPGAATDVIRAPLFSQTLDTTDDTTQTVFIDLQNNYIYDSTGKYILAFDTSSSPPGIEFVKSSNVTSKYVPILCVYVSNELNIREFTVENARHVLALKGMHVPIKTSTDINTFADMLDAIGASMLLVPPHGKQTAPTHLTATFQNEEGMNFLQQLLTAPELPSLVVHNYASAWMILPVKQMGTTYLSTNLNALAKQLPATAGSTEMINYVKSVAKIGILYSPITFTATLHVHAFDTETSAPLQAVQLLSGYTVTRSTMPADIIIEKGTALTGTALANLVTHMRITLSEGQSIVQYGQQYLIRAQDGDSASVPFNTVYTLPP